MTQAAYARRCGLSRVAVHKRTMTKGGPIPVHGPKKLIDVAEADALWEATKSPQGAGGAEAARLAVAGTARRRGRLPACQHHTAYPTADGAWEVLEWRAWVPNAAACLAQALEVEVARVRPLLEELVETQLEAFGLYAADVQAQLATWLAETEG
jgi:hypothetical protein